MRAWISYGSSPCTPQLGCGYCVEKSVMDFPVDASCSKQLIKISFGDCRLQATEEKGTATATGGQPSRGCLSLSGSRIFTMIETIKMLGYPFGLPESHLAPQKPHR